MASVSGEIGEQGRFARGFRVERGVIKALMLRELHTRYGRENIGYLWLILEPMLLATMIGLIHARSATHFGSDIKPVPLALVGYCNFMTFRSMVTRAEGVLEANVQLFYHRSITAFDILMARGLLEIAGTFVSFTILMGLAIAIGVASPPARPLMYLLGVACMFLFSFGLSMVICGITHDRRAMGRLVHPITYVMLPLSGSFFVMNKLPGQIQELFSWIPLAHIFELLRYGWFESAKPDFIAPLYLAGWIIVPTLLGLLLLSIVRKRIQLS